HRQRLEIRRRGRVVGEGAVAIVADGGAVGAERIGGIAGGQADAVAGVLDRGRGGHDLAVVFVGGGGDVLRHRAAVGDVDGDGRGRGRLDAVVVGHGVVEGVGGLAHRQRLEIRRRGRVVGEGAVAIVADGGAVGAERIGGIAGGQADAVAGVLDRGR